MDRAYERETIFTSARACAHTRRGIALTIGVAIINYVALRENELPRVAITMLNAAAAVIDDAAINTACQKDHLSEIDNWQIHSSLS